MINLLENRNILEWRFKIDHSKSDGIRTGYHETLSSKSEVKSYINN